MVPDTNTRQNAARCSIREPIIKKIIEQNQNANAAHQQTDTSHSFIDASFISRRYYIIHHHLEECPSQSVLKEVS